MVRVIGALCGAAILSSCATGGLDQYAGQSITSAMLEYGEPDGVIDLPDGRRAYQWERTQQTTAVVPNNMGGSGYLAVSRDTDCRFTIIAAYNQTSDDWLVEEVRKPKLRCR